VTPVDAPDRPLRPRAVLFACGQNSVRSPMAAALARAMLPASLHVGSAGVRKGDLDPFAVAAMAEIGINIAEHRPITFEELEDWDGFDFDLIVTLAPEAHHKAIELTRRLAAAVEYWPTADPTAIEGNREQRLDAYRAVRDQLMTRLGARFAGRKSGNE
jgi:protein-tyrosine-phosphatase